MRLRPAQRRIGDLMAKLARFSPNFMSPDRGDNVEGERDALDKLIAAKALALDVVLVTNTEADFAAYPGLRVENWEKSHSQFSEPSPDRRMIS